MLVFSRFLYQLIGIAIIATLSTNGFALASEVTSKEALKRFELFNECRAMNIMVEKLPQSARNIGLRERSVQSVIESRLRSARLYDEDADEILYINTNVSKRAFSVSLSYTKVFMDYASNLRGLAVTWTTGGVGTHGDDGGYILSSLAQYMDQFLTEYLRENEEACAVR